MLFGSFKAFVAFKKRKYINVKMGLLKKATDPNFFYKIFLTNCTFYVDFIKKTKYNKPIERHLFLPLFGILINGGKTNAKK